MAFQCSIFKWMVLFMGVGARLKEAREEKGISLDTLQETTKIQKRYLRAIEEENFDVLPGKFYARAFIKEYASAVNLNVDELFEEFKDDLPQPEEQTEPQYTRIQRTRKESNLSKNSPLISLFPTIIVILLIIGVIFAVWFFMYEKPSSKEEVNQVEEQDDNAILRSPSENDTEENSEDENNEPSTDESNENELELNIVEEGSEENDETTFDLNNVADQLALTLDSSGETWIEVENEKGEQLFYGILAPDESPLELDIIDENKLYFSIGNASVLDIKFNNLDFEYPLNPNENIVQKFWVNINHN